MNYNDRIPPQRNDGYSNYNNPYGMSQQYNNWYPSQYGNPVYNPTYYNSPQQNQVPQQTQQQKVYCRAVTSEEEARAALIELDGSLNIFTLLDKGKIFTKQLEPGNKAPLRTYVLVSDNQSEEKPQNLQNTNEFATKADYDVLYAIVERLETDYEGLQKDIDTLMFNKSKNKPEKK